MMATVFSTFRSVMILAAVVLAGLAIHFIVFRIAVRLAKRTENTADDILLKQVRSPARLLIPLILLIRFLAAAGLPDELSEMANRILVLLIILAMTWTLIRGTFFISEVILSKYQLERTDNLKARQVHTQIKILEKILIFVVCLLAFALLLMSFPRIRQVGASILASAGIIGIIVGFAAQRSIATLIAGLQIAFTQPIRLDDVLVVENEWGRVPG